MTPSEQREALVRQVPRLRRVARRAMNTYVGRNWPSMETLRYNGIGADFQEDREHDPAIRRFLSEFSPEVVDDLLAIVEEASRG